MPTTDSHAVSVQIATPRAFAAVRATVPIARVPVVFADYLNQVYDAARSGLVRLDGQNIFVYRNSTDPNDADTEFGVGVSDPFPPAGAVKYAMVPAGEVATTTHWGDYAGLRAAHTAVIDWCRANGRARTGTRWEIYGHWTDDPSQLRTDVYHLLEPRA